MIAIVKIVFDRPKPHLVDNDIVVEKCQDVSRRRVNRVIDGGGLAPSRNL